MVFSASEADFGGGFDLEVGVFAPDALEEVAVALGEVERLGKGAGEVVVGVNGVEGGLLDGDDVVGGHDADVGDEGGGGEAPAVAEWGDVGEDGDVEEAVGLEGVEHGLGGAGHALLEVANALLADVNGVLGA